MVHNKFMQRALDIAANGWPAVVPNPLVGCVITFDDKIVSEGYHKAFGGPHAEVNAVSELPATIDPSKCTVYVTLEPCSHHGKTPPCAEMLIQKGFKKVVIAAQDPNPQVSGKGLEQLKKAGIEVITGVLEKEAIAQNKWFNCFYRNNRPYIILKWAMTADGFIGKMPPPQNKLEQVITREEAQRYVHRLRSEVSGIMVGKNTVMHDNPRLTTRMVPGRNPVRIVFDPDLELSPDLNVFKPEAGTIIVNNKKEEEAQHLLFLKLDFGQDVLLQLMTRLHQLQVQSVLVEGGAQLLQSFIDAELWDEALIFQNPELTFGDGVKAPVFPIKNSFDLVGDDKLFHHFKNETLPAKGPLSKEIF